MQVKVEVFKRGIRLARLEGESLIVRQLFGIKQLTDPFSGDVVCLQSGRKACLVGYFQLPGSQGLDAEVLSRICEDGKVRFTFLGIDLQPVFLDQLREGQRVELGTTYVPAYTLCPPPVLQGSAYAVAV